MFWKIVAGIGIVICLAIFFGAYWTMSFSRKEKEQNISLLIIFVALSAVVIIVYHFFMPP